MLADDYVLEARAIFSDPTNHLRIRVAYAVKFGNSINDGIQFGDVITLDKGDNIRGAKRRIRSTPRPRFSLPQRRFSSVWDFLCR